jgi:hypothetical protein
MNGGRSPSRLAVAVLGVIALSLGGCVPLHRAHRAAPASPIPGPPSAHRDLIFWQALGAGEGPAYVTLEAGHAYRLEPAGPFVKLSPRLMNQLPPLFIRPLFGQGTEVRPSFSGEYRIDVIRGLPLDSVSLSVRVYREEYDDVELACIRDRTEEACRPLRTAEGGRQGLFHRPLRVLGVVTLAVLSFLIEAR